MLQHPNSDDVAAVGLLGLPTPELDRTILYMSNPKPPSSPPASCPPFPFPAPDRPTSSVSITVLELGPDRPGADTIAMLARRLNNPFARVELDMLAAEIEHNHTIGNRRDQIAHVLARLMFTIGVWRFTVYSNVPGYEVFEGEG